MEYLIDRITIKPDLCNGKPTIRGKRITVATVLGYLSVGEEESEILRQFPSLEKEDIKACLDFAILMLDREFTVKAFAS